MNKISSKTTLLLSTLACLIGLSAFADGAIDPANRFPGYEPTIMNSDAEVTRAFETMEKGFKGLNPFLFQFGTQCTARAETWAYDFYKTQNIKSQKVFVFYTSAFKEYQRRENGKNFKWWFHVSPYVLVKNSAGVVEERVMDRAFSDNPQTMKEWTDLFIKSKEACIENVPFKQFEGDVTGSGASYNKNAHCYIVRAPMVDMFPLDIDARERNLQTTLDWDMNQVKFASKSLLRKAREKYLDRVGLSL